LERVSAARIGSLAERTAQLAIELRVSDLAASIDFYRGAGFILERQTQTFAAMQIGGRYLLLSERVGAAAGATPPNLRIVVDDVDQTFARARAMGWTTKTEPEDRGYGLRDFMISDPDGYEVRFAALSQQ
jgi:uncharacterized glyoxalase superfamily protein PhnB